MRSKQRLQHASCLMQQRRVSARPLQRKREQGSGSPLHTQHRRRGRAPVTPRLRLRLPEVNGAGRALGVSGCAFGNWHRSFTDEHRQREAPSSPALDIARWLSCGCILSLQIRLPGMKHHYQFIEVSIFLLCELNSLPILHLPLAASMSLQCLGKFALGVTECFGADCRVLASS